MLEKVLPVTEGARYPVCLAGARACPPEDCGGVWGYARLPEVIQNQQDEEYEETMTWLGGSFNRESFDLDEVNARLAPLGRRIRKKA